MANFDPEAWLKWLLQAKITADESFKVIPIFAQNGFKTPADLADKEVRIYSFMGGLS